MIAFNARNSHRQRIGKARTKHGLKPTLAEVQKALNDRRCAEHGADYQGMHESGDGRCYVWHVRFDVGAFGPGNPPSSITAVVAPKGEVVPIPPGTTMLSDISGGPW